MSAVVVEFFNQSPVFIALVILCILVGLLVMVVLPVFLGSWLADRDELRRNLLTRELRRAIGSMLVDAHHDREEPDDREDRIG